MDKLFLIDSNSLICRFFFGVPEYINSKGQNINAVKSFLNFWINLLNKNKNSKILFLFDKCRNNWRNEIFPIYKQNRIKQPDDLRSQIDLIMEFLEKAGLKIDYHNEFEADDLIGTYVYKFKDEYEIHIFSTDKDLLQLLDYKVKFFQPFDRKFLSNNYVLEKFGINSYEIPLFLALSGDKSDNIPGIYKVGPKKAGELINKYGDLETIIANEGIKYEPARIFLEITTIRKDGEIKHINLETNINNEYVKSFFQLHELDF